MEESAASTVSDGEIIAIQFGLASHREILRSSFSDCPISHASQLANPFLGLPLEIGKCESCGTAEPGKCEGHFGYIELPIPVYHPSHISELRRMLSLLCLKCLKLKTSKPTKNNGVMERLLSACCEETCHVSIKESKTNDGAFFLELRLPAKYRVLQGSWSFLERYGYRYGDGSSRTLLPSEAETILKRLPPETRRKLASKGYFPQDGYILRYLPVPPNCLSVPDISDGVSVMSSDLSASMLKKVLKQIEIIRSSRSGDPNFESHEVEANELQIAVSQYLQVRGTGKAARDADNRYGVSKEGTNSSTKAWLEKMRTLFISKGSGFSSRSVITGDAYKPVNEIGLPSEIAQKMTFEERVNMHNIQYLQSLVDKNLCLTFRDGLSTYSLREGSKGHTFLKLGQIVHRRIMDGDIVFINRPPTTHKHSLQALRVYIHDDHTVKINPLMCGPLAADFDGDCVHLFYPQSLAARAEVVELFSVEKQLLSSHSGNLNLQLATDSLLSLKTMFKVYFLDRVSAQQLAMYASTSLPPPALFKACASGPRWTALQVLQTALPSQFDCHGERLLIRGSEVIKLDFNRDVMAAVINEILTSLFFNKSPKEALNLLDSLQPLLMENLFAEGFSLGLDDFFIPISELQTIQSQIQDISPLLFQLRSSYNELVQMQFESYMRLLKVPVANFILRLSALGNLIDSRSDSAIDKVVQQIGFLGLQLSDRRKFYSKSLVEDVASLFQLKYPLVDVYPSEEFGVVKSCFFHGLDPYEEIVHSIATREVIVRSSKGLAEPGTLFKNLMAILRDVVVCYDGTVRNISSNSIIQFEYGIGGVASQSLFPAGEPVGVLAATAMSNPAYKAVLDSSPSSNSSWDMMKEILFCRVNFKNDMTDRRVILYLNDCDCGRRHCQENSSYVVKNHLQKVSLRDAAVEFLIEYKQFKSEPGSSDLDAGLVGHIHLNKALILEANISMLEILQKCDDEVKVLRKKKKLGSYFKTINLSVSECCFFQHASGKWSNMPCLKFFWPDMTDTHLEKMSHIMADMICPILLDTVIKGDPRISTVSIIWISPNTTTWVQNPCNDSKGELAVEVTLEKTAVRQSGDAWRIVLDCCLPIFHLIDTRRSIPYAIKQIQELLGISCTFDQVVQRLSTSVTSVTKGVLKEHLLLLASSMTCAGNLIGFNMSGIKALYRALSVQVPFTEATLYTPRKCFERASEKCHVDSLASIVASCSWGKRVAVGTGAKFDILWDNKETGIDEKPIDVYSFLQLVRGSNGEEIDTGCLGDDVDRFDWDDAFLEPALSPEQENKAVFEDAVEEDLDTQRQADSSWDVPSSNAEASGWAKWGLKKDQSQQEDSLNAGGWPNQGKKKDQHEDSPKAGWGPRKNPSEQEHSSKAGGWDSSKSNIKEPSFTWDKQVKEADDRGSGWSQWTVNKDQPTSNSWDAPQSQITGLSPAGAERTFDQGNEEGEGQKQPWKKDAGKSSWGQASNMSGGWTSEKDNEKSGSETWDSKRKENKKYPSWGQESDTNWGSAIVDDSDTTWGSKKANKPISPQGWGSAKVDDSDTAWDTKKPNKPSSAQGWGSAKAAEDNEKQGAWGQPGASKWKASTLEEGSETGSKSWRSNQEQGKAPSSWGVSGDPTWKNSEGDVEWGSKKPNDSNWKNSRQKEDGESGGRGWGSKKEESKIPSSWGVPSDSTWKNSSQSAGSWDAKRSGQPGSPLGWGPSKAGTGDNKEKQGASTWNNFAQKEDSEACPNGWGSKKEASNASSWGVSSNSKWNKTAESSGEWGSKKSTMRSSPLGWGSAKADSKGWSSRKEENKSPSSWKAPVDSTWKTSTENDGAWGSNRSTQPSSPLAWGSSKAEASDKNEDHDASTWKGTSTWKNSPHMEDSGSGSKGCGSRKEENKSLSSWEANDSNWKNSTESAGAWDSKKSTQPSSPLGWGSAKATADSENVGENVKQDGWEQPNASAWKKDSDGNTQTSDGESQPAGSQGWDSPKATAGNESQSQSPWGQPGGSGGKRKRPEGGRGWGSSNSGEWKNRKNRPPKQPGTSNDNSTGVGFTATRKRMDLFATEEQDALAEAEAVMQSCRKIMHQSGYNDGDPLPADDQTYIINNVLNYHPDKAAKIGAGIEYITVKKHSSFQESRCFYVVSTDGQTVDFSYIKCLENLIKEKYPSVADAFISKYFSRQRTGNRQQE